MKCAWVSDHALDCIWCQTVIEHAAQHNRCWGGRVLFMLCVVAAQGLGCAADCHAVAASVHVRLIAVRCFSRAIRVLRVAHLCVPWGQGYWHGLKLSGISSGGRTQQQTNAQTACSVSLPSLLHVLPHSQVGPVLGPRAPATGDVRLTIPLDGTLSVAFGSRRQHTAQTHLVSGACRTRVQQQHPGQAVARRPPAESCARPPVDQPSQLLCESPRRPVTSAAEGRGHEDAWGLASRASADDIAAGQRRSHGGCLW